jgi:transposase
MRAVSDLVAAAGPDRLAGVKVIGVDEHRWASLGRTLWRRRGDILAFFDHHASIGPTETINGRLEALRRNALGFRNLTHYRWRSLLHSGALLQIVNAL